MKNSGFNSLHYRYPPLPILYMKPDEQIEIPLSKTKLTLMLAGAITFVAVGFWFVIKHPVSNLTMFGKPTALFVVGISSILFFGLFAVFISKKLIENVPGFLINNEGITDNSSAVPAGLILWKDIRVIKKSSVGNKIFIAIVVDNPDEYIARQSNVVIRKFMKLHQNIYDSPFSISAAALKCNLDELYFIIIREFRKQFV